MNQTQHHPLMSDVTTHGVRVGANAFYLPDESTPEDNEFVFGYRIVILNDSDRTVTLQTRHWDLIDAEGELREVDGEGVVGQFPHLAPGEAFKYHSFAVLPTPWGTMEGHYHFRAEDNQETLKVRIGRFYLTRESVQHTQRDATDTSKAAQD
ncbi:MAG: Co2+/Mg2+ efflux protein ApaG [Phycisphaeraceae bacterium]